MKKHLRLSTAAFALLSALAVFSLTPYSAQAGNDALNVTSAKITLPQAISAAERKVGGQYKVEVVKGTEVFDVIVDANDGTVLSIKKDVED